jgi:hypothetical protein
VEVSAERRHSLKLLTGGILLFLPSAALFYGLVHRGTDSPLVYLAAMAMYVGLGIALYAIVILLTNDEGPEK